MHTPFAAISLAAFLTAPAFAQDEIRIGVEGNYPPFSQVAPDGSMSGFDIDIANTLAHGCRRSARWRSRNGTG